MLPRAGRLRKERDFRAVFSRVNSQTSSSAAARMRPRTQSSPMMVVHVRPRRRPSASARAAGEDELPGSRPAPDGLLRFGFSISKKVAKRAHDRNRVKRRLSEIARLDVVPVAVVGQNFDCVVVARIPAVSADYRTLRSDFLSLLSRAGLIRPLVEGEA